MRGTTPIVTLDIEQNFDGYTVVATIDQDGTQVTKSSTGNDVKITKVYDEQSGDFLYSSVAVYLSQAETLKFDVGKARVQLRWIDVLGEAEKSDIASVDFDEVLLERVIHYGE